MAEFVRWMVVIVASWMAICHGFAEAHELDYKDALTKCIIFLECQRSGPLPPTNRVPWRGDSALDDGKLAGVDLVGGYYDAGDNVKFGLPMAFTITTLAWGAVAYGQELKDAGEFDNTVSAIRWGTDYFLKAAAKPGVLYVEVGEPNKDHECWINPENMKTPRDVLFIDEKTPGTEHAAETAAALAASAIVFKPIDAFYSHGLLDKAKTLFRMAKSHRGTFDGECPFYCSFSGYEDELMWGATWLYLATQEEEYMKFLTEETVSAAVTEFSWDLKYAGAQIILSEYFFQGQTNLQNIKTHADSYVCSVLPESPFHQIPITPGGLIHFREGANTQYVTGTAMLLAVYSDTLAKYNQTVPCGDKQITPAQIMAFGKSQIDYILGKNPLDRSIMVGFGKDPPLQAHHRGASVTLKPGEEMECAETFVKFFNVPDPNVHELTGAILGGPDKNDGFIDLRNVSIYTEPCTYVNSVAVGVLAKLASNPSGAVAASPGTAASPATAAPPA